MQGDNAEEFKRPDLSVYPVRREGHTTTIYHIVMPIPRELDPLPFPSEMPLCALDSSADFMFEGLTERYPPYHIKDATCWAARQQMVVMVLMNRDRDLAQQVFLSQQHRTMPNLRKLMPA